MNGMNEFELKIARRATVQAIEYIGSQFEVSRLLDMPMNLISVWASRGWFPEEFVGEISSASRVPIQRLRPDLFRNEEDE